MRSAAKPSSTPYVHRALAVVALGCAVACSGAARPKPADPEPEPATVETRTVKLVSVYRGADRLRVTVVRFAPPDGDDALRLIVDASGQQTAWWMSGASKTDLTVVPIRDSQKFIYDELGVYDGERLGTPCDTY